MKLKHRKGSTLALTLIIFAVLMIFATFILNFMVTENKQAMYYQNKTQAYYIARSGAEAVVDTIINELTYEEKLLLIEMEEHAIKGGTVISPLIGEIPISIKKNKDNIEIISTGSSNEVTETVTFVMGIKSDNSVEIDKSFIVITKKEDSENHTPNYLVINEDIIFGANEEKYKPYNFSNLEYDINSDSIYPDNWSVLGVDNGEVDYVVDNLNIDKKLEIKGKVNIYVKGNVNITSNGWATNTNKDNLNIFIIPKPKDNINRLTFNAKNVGNESIRANFYVGSGNVDIKLQNSILNSNIISNGKKIYLHSQTGGDEHQVLNGSIYAPLSLVHMDLNNLGLNGYVVAKNLKLFHQNGKDYPKESKLVLQDDSKQIIDTESKSNIFKGYYK